MKMGTTKTVAIPMASAIAFGASATARATGKVEAKAGSQVIAGAARPPYPRRANRDGMVASHATARSVVSEKSWQHLHCAAYPGPGRCIGDFESSASMVRFR